MTSLMGKLFGSCIASTQVQPIAGEGKADNLACFQSFLEGVLQAVYRRNLPFMDQ